MGRNLGQPQKAADALKLDCSQSESPTAFGIVLTHRGITGHNN
jgi:hypothetical protein